MISSKEPGELYLQRANGRIQNWKQTPKDISFELYTMGKINIEFNGRPLKNYLVTLDGKTFGARANLKGIVSIKNDSPGAKFKWYKLKVKK